MTTLVIDMRGGRISGISSDRIADRMNVIVLTDADDASPNAMPLAMDGAQWAHRRVPVHWQPVFSQLVTAAIADAANLARG